MRINVGKRTLNYIDSTPDDFFILAQVIPSSMSYERPVLIRTIHELNVWTGKDWPGYELASEMIGRGSSLALTKPIKEKVLQEVPELFMELPETHQGDLIRVASNSGTLSDPSTGLLYKRYRWIEGFSYVEESLAPSEDLAIDSLNNRDTLRVLDSGIHFHPVYGEPEPEPMSLPSSLFSYRTDYRYVALYMKVVWPEFGEEPGYFIIGGLLFWYKSKPKFLSSFLNEEVTSLSDLKNKLTGSYGFTIEGDHIRKTDYNPIDVTYDYEWPGFSLEPDWEKEQSMLWKYYTTSPGLNLWSKTIGRGDEDIKLTIKHSSRDKYTFLVSRGDYTETYFGLTPREFANESTQKSKLVYTDWLGKDSDTLTPGTWKLLGAKYEEYTGQDYWSGLRRLSSLAEDVPPDFLLIPNPELYKVITERKREYWEEYWLLSNLMKEWNSQALIQNLDSPYKLFKAETKPETGKAFEVYLVKSDSGAYDFWTSGDKPGPVEVTTDPELTNPLQNSAWFNMTGEKEKRLIYFYRDMIHQGIEKPGFWVFLDGLLSDSTLPTLGNELRYNPPKDKNVETLLRKTQSNWISDNNIIYWTDKLLDESSGLPSASTTLTRFVASKIARELEKNKFKILDNQSSGDVQKSLDNILGRIEKSYGSVIRSIRTDSLYIDWKGGKIKLNVLTTMSDLPKSNISLDILININK